MTSASESKAATSNADSYLFEGPAGTDTITAWGAGDRIITTSALPSLSAASNDRFTLADGGSVKVFYPSGAPMTRLMSLGSSTNAGGKTYYVYARSGDTSASPTLQFGNNAIPELTVDPTINGAFYVREHDAVRNARILPVVVHGSYRAFQMQLNTTLTNVTIDGLTATDVARDCFFLRKVFNVTVSNFNCKHGSTPSTLAELPEGIALMGGDGVYIGPGRVEGFVTAPEWDEVNQKWKYRNGDGIAVDNAPTNVRIVNVTSVGNSDAGFDLKLGANNFITGVVSVNNSRGLRCWYNCSVGTYESRDDRSSAVWVRMGANIVIDMLKVSSSKPLSSAILTSEGAKVETLPDGTQRKTNATITIKACNFSGVAPGTLRFKADGWGTTLVLGPTCL
jgi:hypothetical protein